MLNRTKIVFFILVLVVLVAGGVLAIAQKATPKAQDRVALREDEIKQLLLLMDTDKNGKISRQEWMNFWAAEFDRLDKDKSGDLDVKELSQFQFRPIRPPAVGK